jgi:DNA-binding transcriptional LysR family regulator
MDSVLILRLFVLVARLGSFSAAGRIMGYSASSVLRYMNLLEDEATTPLLQRSSRSITLTEAGEELLRRADTIIRDVDALKAKLLEMQEGVRGTLHVHARALTGNDLIIPVISQFRKSFPDVHVHLTLSDEERIDTTDHSVDVWITTQLPQANSLIARKLASGPRVVCASPAYFADAPLPHCPSELAECDCITFIFDLGQPTWRFRKADAIESIRPRAVIQTTNGQSMRSLAIAGAGVVMLPWWAVEADIEAGNLVRLLEDYDACNEASGAFHATTWALYQKGRIESPKNRAFLDFLGTTIRERMRNGSADLPAQVIKNKGQPRKSRDKSCP